MTDSLWVCPDCGRTSPQPATTTSVTCLNYAGHKRNEAVEMEEQEEE